ncbi:MAG TPA: hypothetical protein VNA19_13750 [Pyrinomonadaceae bacterium]|nr:hypothetical protein [Pyrinomonadaceae bacterium]
MRALVRAVLFIGLLFSPVLSLAQGATAAQASEATRLHQVQRIYIGDMGDRDSAERFRLLLEEQLVKRGFGVVLREEQADAILGGVLSMPVLEAESDARITAQLRTPGGQLLWSGNFGPKLTSFFRFKDPLKLRAEELANRLKKDWEQSAKNSGARKND